MRGYLQRLVSNVQAPPNAIRPLLGSLFSSSISNGAPEGPQEIEEVVVSRQRGAGPIPQSSPEPEPLSYNVPQLPPQPRLTEASKQGVDSGPLPSAHQPFSPLISDIMETQRPTPAEKDASPLLQATDSAAQGHEAEIEETLSQHAQSGSQAPAQDTRIEIINGDVPQRGKVRLQAAPESVAPRSPYSPLLLETIRRIDTEFIRPAAPLSSRPMGAAPSRQNKARPQADDIQIHIGRIEVTAVPPAPARPPAAPVRKSLKLDEYLRRGRGSAS